MTRTPLGVILLCILSALLIVGPGCGDNSSTRTTTTPTPAATTTIATLSPTGLTILLATNFIVLGAILQLVAEATFNDGSMTTPADVTWSSSNTQVATVTPEGLLTTVGIGVVVITALALGLTTSRTIEVGSFSGVWTGVAVIAACAAVGFFSNINFCGDFAPGSEHPIQVELTQTDQRVRGDMWFSDGMTAFGGIVDFIVDDTGLAILDDGNLTLTQANGTFTLTPGDTFRLEHTDGNTITMPDSSFTATFDGTGPRNDTSDIEVMGVSMRLEFQRAAP